jgi:hypothetical protein
MWQGVTGFGEVALCEIPAAYDFSTPDPFWSFLADPYAERVYILKVAPLPLEGTGSDFPYPLGLHALGELAAADKMVNDALYWGNVDFETGSDDTPASALMPGVLNNALNFSASIPEPGAGAAGRANYGYVRVVNTGDLDSKVAGFSWAGREATLYLGGTVDKGKATEQVLKFTEYHKLYTLRVAGITAHSSYFDILIRDPLYTLQQPVQRNTYLGDGATLYEGGDEVKGQYKPVCLGLVYHVPGVVIDEADYTYQFHDGAATGGTAAVTAVYDNAVALSFQEDSADLPNLTVTAGNYATDLSRGLVKVGTEPSSELLADLQGTTETAAADIINLLMTWQGVGVDAASIASYAQQDVGFYCDTGAIDVDQVVSELMASVDGFWTFTRDGKLRIGENTDVRNTAPALTIDGRESADYATVPNMRSHNDDQ